MEGGSERINCNLIRTSKHPAFEPIVLCSISAGGHFLDGSQRALATVLPGWGAGGRGEGVQQAPREERQGHRAQGGQGLSLSTLGDLRTLSPGGSQHLGLLSWCLLEGWLLRAEGISQLTSSQLPYSLQPIYGDTPAPGCLCSV